jgi:hypothetical protein
MEYLMKSPTAQKWILTAEVSAVKPARFSLPVGESRLEFLPCKEGWTGGPDIRKVWLTPAP